MDAFLVVLTCVSVAAAAMFGISAQRARADQARRSAARVAALSDAIDASDPSAPGAASTEHVAVASMFSTAGASVKGLPLVRVAVFGMLATAFVVVVAMANRDHSAPAASVPDTGALELVSMQHTREGRTLTVLGLVRNPPGGMPRARIDAVVLVFDSRNSFIASGRAALDFTTLAPGDESPFVVRIPDVSDVARYRVSFRTETGILRHRDLRDTDHLQASAF
jgi:hypothetical protein